MKFITSVTWEAALKRHLDNETFVEINQWVGLAYIKFNFQVNSILKLEDL